MCLILIVMHYEVCLVYPCFIYSSYSIGLWCLLGTISLVLTPTFCICFVVQVLVWANNVDSSWDSCYIRRLVISIGCPWILPSPSVSVAIFCDWRSALYIIFVLYMYIEMYHGLVYCIMFIIALYMWLSSHERVCCGYYMYICISNVSLVLCDLLVKLFLLYLLLVVSNQD